MLIGTDKNASKALDYLYGANIQLFMYKSNNNVI